MGKVRDFKFGARHRNEKNAKVGQKGRRLRHVIYFYIFNPYYIYGTAEHTKFKYGA